MEEKIQNLVKEISDQMEYLIDVVNSALKKYAKTTNTGDDKK